MKSNIVFNIESPQNGSAIKYGQLVVEGWVFYTTNVDVSNIEIKIGERKYDAAVHLKREDVGECYSKFKEKSLYSGFRTEIDLSDQKDKDYIHAFIICMDSAGNRSSLKKVKIFLNNHKTYKKNKCFSSIKFACKLFIESLKNGKYPKNISDIPVLWKKFIYKVKNSIDNHNVIIGNVPAIDPYKIWCLKNQVDMKKENLLREQLVSNPIYAKISIIMPVYNTNEQLLREAIESVRNQIFENWELCIADDNSSMPHVKEVLDCYSKIDNRIKITFLSANSHISMASNEACKMATGDFLLFMDHDDLLTKDALFEIFQVMCNKKDVDVIYSDDDKIDMNGNRLDPQFKPNWSPELLLSYMYFSHVFCVRKTFFEKVEGFRQGYEGAQDYDLALRITEITDRVYHIPKILYHWRITPESTAFSADTKPYSIISGYKAVQEALRRRQIIADVEQPEFAVKSRIGIYKLKYVPRDNPKVAIIIPTKNKKKLLKQCIDSIEQKNTYNNYEIIIIDNESDERETLDYLESCKHRVIKVASEDGQFNFSRLINSGVRASDAEYIILLNNDTEVIAPNWIEEMLTYMNINGVGAVGAKLLYSDNTVQHAGVILKMLNGLAGHAFKHLPDWHGGYLSYANVVRNYSAVTAACLMTKRSIYNQVNGFDEIDFKVAFNDVDFCMKLINAGYRVVYNPYVKLYHYEGKTRGVEQEGKFDNPVEELNFFKKYKKSDQYYNDNLSLEAESFEINYKNVYINVSKNLRILLISHNLNFEGAPLVQFNVCKSLKDKGYNFTVLSPQDGLLRNKYEEIGISCIIIKSEFLLSYKKNEYINSLENIIKQYNFKIYDIIYANTLQTFWGVEIAKLLEVPSIWGVHESVNYEDYFKSYSYDVSESAINNLKEATKVVFVAEATAKLYQKLNTANFEIIKNGIDVNAVKMFVENNPSNIIRESLGIDYEDVVISIVGTTCHRKGQKVFVEAANILHKSIKNKKIKFLIVGARKSTYLEDILKYINENNLNDCVRVIEECSDVYQYYRISDIFVCASFEESSPLVILEAMAFKVPIISTSVFGIPELVRNEREAILIDAGNSSTLAEKMRELIFDKNKRTLLAHNAYYRLLMKFQIERFSHDYDMCFKSVYSEGVNKVNKYLESIK